MRRLVIGVAVGILLVTLAACTSSGTSSPAEENLQRQADLWAIDQIEKDFHHATTMQDIDLMMSLWAPNATLTVGPGQTATGTDEIRQLFLEKAAAFQPGTHFISDHPAYKLEITVNGDRGTLHFECHFVDPTSGVIALVTAADADVARIDGRWLITNMVGGSTTLTP
jgi:ketosteroid isomerase-like protein